MENWQPMVERMRAAAHARDVTRFCDAWEVILDAMASMLEADNGLVALMLLRLLREDLDEIVVPDMVRAAREGGASWADVGQALGVTRQSARARFREGS